MAEHQLEGRVIGVAWDGTGFGTDGTIWGGEFLAADYLSFDRFARLRPVLLAGGDSGVREPWRVARSYLLDTFGAIPDGPRWTQMASPERLRVIDTMLQRRVSTIPTSSAGRLFDAIASLIGLRHTVSFEGQAAMMLEAAADAPPDPSAGSCDFALIGASPVEIDLRPMIRQIVGDVESNQPQTQIAVRFHNTLVAVIAAVCRRMRSELQLNRVCLSGGCFQNALLLAGCLETLRNEGFEVFSQLEVPANDGGISLGQAAIACEQLRQEN
jgi:hydrogenase maturation protein HypF